VSGAGLDDLFGGLGGFATDASRVHDPFGTGNGRGGGRRTGGQDVTAEVEASLEDVASGTTAIVQIGDRRLEVRIPAGIASGQRIRLSGKAGPDGGDVTLTVRVRPHAIFARSGADLTREIPVSLGEALLGAEIPVGTLDGRTLLLTIPPGTQNGRTFRLRGHGLPRFKAEGRGDLLVRTRVVLPAALDDEGRRLARALADHVRQPNPREGHHEPVGHA
jgi:DnaJ-class molecular chaperone